MNFKPLRDVVLVEKEEITKSQGGIFIPTTAEDRGAISGVVLATGDGMFTDSGQVIELKVKVGDKVLFHKHGCTEVKLEGKTVLLMSESNILGIL